MRGAPSSAGWTSSGCRTTAAGSSTRPRAPSMRCRTSWTRWPAPPPSWWTAASAVAPTWSRPSRAAPTSWPWAAPRWGVSPPTGPPAWPAWRRFSARSCPPPWRSPDRRASKGSSRTTCSASTDSLLLGAADRLIALVAGLVRGVVDLLARFLHRALADDLVLIQRLVDLLAGLLHGALVAGDGTQGGGERHDRHQGPDAVRLHHRSPRKPRMATITTI